MKKLIVLAVLLFACGHKDQVAAPKAQESATLPKGVHAVLSSDVKNRNASTHVYDANSEEHFKEGHIPGATWLAYDRVSEATLKHEKSEALVFYCWNEQCSASHQAAEKAVALGYTNVAVMPEGIVGWKKKGYPVE